MPLAFALCGQLDSINECLYSKAICHNLFFIIDQFFFTSYSSVSLHLPWCMCAVLHWTMMCPSAYWHGAL